MVYLMMPICFFWFKRSQMPVMTSSSISFSWTWGNLKMMDMSLATCFLASRVHSWQDSRQLNAMSMRSLLSKRCWLYSFVNITINDLIKLSLKWISTSSWSWGLISSTGIVSNSSESVPERPSLVFFRTILLTFEVLNMLIFRPVPWEAIKVEEPSWIKNFSWTLGWSLPDFSSLAS